MWRFRWEYGTIKKVTRMKEKEKEIEAREKEMEEKKKEIEEKEKDVEEKEREEFTRLKVIKRMKTG